MKIAIIRGPSLNKWEMVNYQSLGAKNKILAIGSKGVKSSLATDELKIPIRYLHCLGEIASKIPLGIEFLYQILGSPLFLINLEKSIKGFDIAHVAEVYNGYSWQAVKAKEKGMIKKVVATVWETIPKSHESYRQQINIKAKVIRGVDCFVVPTTKAKNTLIAEGADPSKVKLIPMGVDLNLFKPDINGIPKLRRRLKINSDQTVLLSIGRMVEAKGFKTLIKAVAALPKYKVDFKLILAGQGAIENRLKELANRLGLGDHVHFLGLLPYSKMPEVYNLADIFILASERQEDWEEQYGMVLVEAMASGLPIIVSDTEVTREVVGSCGLFFQEGNGQDLVKKMSKLIDSKSLRSELAKKAFIRSRSRYNSNIIGSKIEQLYRQLF
ncbi:glycosyltransferase family 4 protein [Candidatus Daviesbacteria bacterium]|nr:glycosyltransferase family 4 protein [Candidatus Daviesbacteria bacterium]